MGEFDAARFVEYRHIDPHFRTQASATDIEVVDELHIIGGCNAAPSSLLGPALIVDRRDDFDLDVCNSVVAEM